MADKTGIEWTQATWNPIVGCTHVSAGCDNCYAAREASGRLSHLPEYKGLARNGKFTGEVRLLPERLDQPARWRRPRRVFVNSMSDLFHDGVPDEYIARVWAAMAAAPRHTFQLLTKRHGRMRSLLADPGWPDFVAAVHGEHHDGAEFNFEIPRALPNLHLGVSVESQGWVKPRVGALRDTPAAVRWVSAEPLLGSVDLSPYLADIDWVVVGGESGPRARPMHPAWARSLRDQCAAAGVPFLFKQWGEHLPAEVYDDPSYFGGRVFRHPKGGTTTAAFIRERGVSGTFRGGETRPMRPGDVNGLGQMLDLDTIAVRVGKKAAGRELDGVIHDGYPAAVAG